MRYAVLAYPNKKQSGGKVVPSTFGNAGDLKILHENRVANEETFPKEMVVRLPRRIGRPPFSRQISISRLFGWPEWYGAQSSWTGIEGF